MVIVHYESPTLLWFVKNKTTITSVTAGCILYSPKSPKNWHSFVTCETVLPILAYLSSSVWHGGGGQVKLLLTFKEIKILHHYGRIKNRERKRNCFSTEVDKRAENKLIQVSFLFLVQFCFALMDTFPVHVCLLSSTCICYCLISLAENALWL